MNSAVYNSKTLVYTDPQQATFVYKAWDTLNSRYVALKEQHFSNPADRAEMTREAELLGSLQHPAVCQLYDILQWESDGDFVFTMVMEWLDTDLEQETMKLRKIGGRWKENDAVRLLWEITEVLAEAQRREICHRDIKPPNLFTNQSAGGFKIADFGSAKNAIMTTLSHTLAGTPEFLSPELRSAYASFLTTHIPPMIQYNPYKSDVFALGLTVVYMLRQGVMQNVYSERDVKVLVGGLEVTEDLKRILEKMLEIEAGNRPDFVRLEEMTKGIFSVETRLKALKEALESEKFDIVSHDLVWVFSWNISLTSTTSLQCSTCNAWYVSGTKCATCEMESISLSEIPEVTESTQITDPHHEVLKRITEEDPTPVVLECVVCRGEYTLYPFVDWRCAYLGTPNSYSCLKVCSEECLRIHNSNPVDAPMWNYRVCVKCKEMTTTGYIPTCKLHILCMNCSELGINWSSYVPGKICPQCRETPIARVDITSRCSFLISEGLQSYIRVVHKEMDTKGFTPIRYLTLWSQSKCHYCHFPVCHSALVFFIYCGEDVNSVCSPECFLQYFRTEICTACNQKISLTKSGDFETGKRLICSTGKMKSEGCRMCVVGTGDVQLGCKHWLCALCVVGYLEKYPEERFHCPYCGYLGTSLEDLITN